MPFIPHTDQQRREMLDEIGMTAADLFAEIPAEARAGAMDLPDGLGESEVRAMMEGLASRNASAHGLLCFVGGGVYDHYVPAAVDALAGRSEFYTAYTPYQPEASQGTLQAIYEYQSMIARLTELPVANASLYDGGSAIFEAVLMAIRSTRNRHRVLVCQGVNPLWRTMLHTYAASLPVEIVEVPLRGCGTDREAMRAELDDRTAAVVLQNPGFLGTCDDYGDLADAARKAGALTIVSCYPVSLGLLKTPGEMGADIAVGEGQSLGLELGFGGPYLGFLATREAHTRKMPGRVAGRTVDAQGRDGFVLTLQAREQHIRREKATSNICTNQGLMAIRALIHLSLLGRSGLVELARLCAANARYAFDTLTGLEGVWGCCEGAFFNEFAIRLPRPAEEVVAALMQRGFAAGIPLGRWYAGMDDCLLTAFTEKHRKADIDAFVAAVGEVL